jgi:hypothetical protein
MTTRAERLAAKKAYRDANKVAIAAKFKAWYEMNKEGQQARCRAAYHANREERLAYSNEYQRAIAVNPVRRRRRNDAERNRRYRLTNAQYDAMVAQQRGLCAICGNPPNVKGTLFVDHDHDSGVIRGLLCGHCNSGIGMLGDSLDRLRRALRYLRNAEKRL